MIFPPLPLIFLNEAQMNRRHLLQSATTLYEPVSQGGLAVIDVRDDRKISDVLHQGERLSA